MLNFKDGADWSSTVLDPGGESQRGFTRAMPSGTIRAGLPPKYNPSELPVLDSSSGEPQVWDSKQ